MTTSLPTDLSANLATDLATDLAADLVTDLAADLVTDRTPTAEQKALFHQQGYLIVKNLLSPEQAAQIVERCDRLFQTQFETGIYPDEWYGRPGPSQPNATRQMTGLWRCDRTLASFTLSSAIARLNATLMGWDSARYGLDTFWAKPPSAPSLYFHRNSTYVSAIDPPEAPTCWIALSATTADTAANTGTLEIVPGSHRWPAFTADKVRFLHAPAEDYRTPLWQAAAEVGLAQPSDRPLTVPVELSAGSAIVLHGNLWHGSGPNHSDSQTRQSLSIATLHGEAKYQPPGSGKGYIFDRYRMINSLELHESFYPVLWRRADGYRTPFLKEYCQDALAD
ncbi:MAG: phytanoyl-CoA dioxygenase family protein [Phormidesmis sp.]